MHPQIRTVDQGSYCKECNKAQGAAYRQAVRSIPEGREKGQPWEVGDSFDDLTVVAMTTRPNGASVLTCVCSCGKLRRGIYAAHVPIMGDRTCGDATNHPELRPHSYSAAHLALRRHLGPAEMYHCFCGDRAREWSYLGRRDYPDMDVAGKNQGSPWSWIMSDYAPMCSRCHRAWETSRHMLNKRGVGHTELAELLSLGHWIEDDRGEWMDESELTSGVNVYGDPANV